MTGQLIQLGAISREVYPQLPLSGGGLLQILSILFKQYMSQWARVTDLASGRLKPCQCRSRLPCADIFTYHLSHTSGVVIRRANRTGISPGGNWRVESLSRSFIVPKPKPRGDGAQSINKSAKGSTTLFTSAFQYQKTLFRLESGQISLTDTDIKVPQVRC